MAARRINEECVVGKGKGLRTGGHIGVGSGRGFYVVLGKVWEAGEDRGVITLL